MIEHGIHTTKADYWIHLHPLARRVYCFAVSEMLNFVIGLPVIPAKSRNGVKTGEGYKVSKEAHCVRKKDVPAKYLDHVDWKNLTNREAGKKYGEQAVLDMLNDCVIFPTADRPFYFATDQARQYDGIDIINGTISIDVKTETYFPTAYLFVQKAEYHHDPNIRPDGSRHVTELPAFKPTESPPPADDSDWAEAVKREVESARRKQQQQPNVCAQCGGGVNTDPPTDAPTIPFGGVLLHPECVRFYK